MDILLLNAGSSSLKCSCYNFANGQLRARAQAEWAGGQSRFRCAFLGQNDDPRADWELVSWRGPAAAVQQIFQRLRDAGWNLEQDLLAVGHRVVHGGDFTAATQICPELRVRIQQLLELAPQHNQASLEVLQEVERELPLIPQVAVFDSGFHATLSMASRTYAVPWKWSQEWGIRRFGFHGLSHQYCSHRAAEWLAEKGQSTRPENLRIVVCHLGHGCSLAAVCGGLSIDTTMGFTPLEGLVMATRSGSVDPGIIPYLQTRYGLTPEQIQHTLNCESGLLGISGLSADVRELQQAAERGHERAELAISTYVHSIRRGIGAMVASLGGIDALVFTAGVGENSPSIRARICEPLGFLGVRLDAKANITCHGDSEISCTESRTKVLVLITQEEQEMFQQVQKLLHT